MFFHGIRFKVNEDWLSGDNHFLFMHTLNRNIFQSPPNIELKKTISRTSILCTGNNLFK